MVELRVVGGHVALDLVNTVAPRAAGDHDEYLGTPAQLLGWARRVDLVTGAEAARVESAWAAAPESASRALEAAIDVREATYGILTAALTGGGAARGELERLGRRWTAAVGRSTLVLAGPPGPAAVLSAAESGAMLVPDRLAHAAVDLVRTADLAQVRECPVADGGCGWLFLDRSRNGSRRWCAMEDCGTQAKSRRLTERRRARR
jgi:predicted RNA-binding Zn ribbon-like protein